MLRLIRALDLHPITHAELNQETVVPTSRRHLGTRAGTPDPSQVAPWHPNLCSLSQFDHLWQWRWVQHVVHVEVPLSRSGVPFLP
jgi:hypothetical protein